MITVGFTGLPSAGKSTMVNALAGKRVLESGICRTTTEVCLVGSRNAVCAPKGPEGPKRVNWVSTQLRSDDGVEFCALDLPGICDAEDTGGSFDAVTHEWAAKCDIVAWVTDARTALMTKHEVAELTRLMDAIREKADEDGTLYQFMIVLAKYDEPAHAEPMAPIEYLPGEIRTGREDTTIGGHLERVERAFPGTRVVKFNAFARIETTPCSAALKALVGASSQRRLCTELEAREHRNAAFELAWATENITEKRLAQMSRVLRATRVRAIAAEKALSDLCSRIAPGRDTITLVTFTCSYYVSNNGYKEKEGQLPSFVAKIDTAACDIGLLVERCRTGTDGTCLLSLDADKRCIHIGRWSISGSLSNGSLISQILAPTVRPVYGDVYINPAPTKVGGGYCVHLDHCGAELLSVYIGEGAGPKYVLKIGEIPRHQIEALLSAIPAGARAIVQSAVPSL
jgi:GTPase SAR1 family protein